jgi:toxin secretion/phage lysis holin
MAWFNPKFLLTDLGFEGPMDLLTSTIGFKGNIIAPIAFLFAGGLSLFIEENVWGNPAEVYFLAVLIGIDLFTGVWKAIKFRKDPEKKFRSRRISRTVGKTITYSLLLFMAFNLDKNMHSAFFWMPYSVLGVFYATEAWSIIENLSEIGYLNVDFVKYLKQKLNIANILKSKPESEAKNNIRKRKPKK